MSAVATRRTLFAGAGAVILGSGVSAGVAASVADHAEADTKLIALCTRYVEADLHHAEMCQRQDAMPQPLTPALNAEWHQLDDLGLEQGVIMLDLEPRITAIPALSQAGVQAKAAAVARMSRFYKDENGGAMLRSLLADLLPVGRAGAV